MQFKDRLKRNYELNPLKYGESPEYEDLFFLYITCNLTYDELGPYFNNMKRCTVRSYIKKAGITKPKNMIQKSLERRNLEKYGVNVCSKIPQSTEKFKKTCLEKYGVDNPNKCREVREKIEKTNLERYGYKVANKSEKSKEKFKQTCQERYGANSYFETEEFKQKSKETCLEKYGVEYGSQSKQFQDKVKQTSLEKFGVPYCLMSNEIIQKGKRTCLEKWGTTNISTSHIDPKILELINNKDSLYEYINKFEIKDLKEISNTLGISYDGLKKKLHELDLWDKIEHNVCYAENEIKTLFPDFKKTRSIIPPQEIDFYNNEYKLGIEYNGIYWHSELFKAKNYHQEKSKKARNNGIFLYHIFEHEWIDERKRPIILSQLNNLMNKNNEKIGARKCIIKNISASIANEFLSKNHLQGKDQSSIRYGLFYNDELVSVMTFCKPRFNRTYEWELSRFCNKLNTSVIGAASKLFKNFIKEYNPKSIISYSNFSKTRGILYKTLGFTLKGLSAPNYIWFKGLKILSRYQCQKHLLEEYKEYGSTEDEIMHNRGYLKCYDCGSLVWSIRF